MLSNQVDLIYKQIHSIIIHKVVMLQVNTLFNNKEIDLKEEIF